jgi:nucleoside-diphosphate-sugar epimerase
LVNQGYPTSARWVKALWDQDLESLHNTPPQHFVNVQDDARLHVIGLANPAVQNERIFPITGPVTINEITTLLRQLYPARQWEDIPDNGKDLSTFEPAKRAEQLHLKAYGMGFINLKDSVAGNAADLEN